MAGFNDAEREQWVWNDEYLYSVWLGWSRRNKGGMRGFLRANREEIDELIRHVVG